jgi:hypothetical protein
MINCQVRSRVELGGSTITVEDVERWLKSVELGGGVQYGNHWSKKA